MYKTLRLGKTWQYEQTSRMAWTQREEAWDEVGDKVDGCQDTHIFVYVFKTFSVFLLLG